MAFYNNPAFGQAASNIAAMFAPPSGGDAAGWANAKATQAKAQQLQWLFDNYGDPSASQRSAVTGVQSYGATPEGFRYNVDETNATARRGDDLTFSASRLNNADNNAGALERLGITDTTDRRGQDLIFDASRMNNTDNNARALTEREMIEAAARERLGVTDATSRVNNVLDNKAKAIGALFGPLNQGQIRPDVPAEFMDALQLPEVAAVAGAPKPLNEGEVKGGILQGMDPELQAAITFGNTPVENIVTPGGPQISTRLDAIGKEPVIADRSPGTIRMYKTRDGREGRTVDGISDMVTGQPIDADARVGTISDTSESFGTSELSKARENILGRRAGLTSMIDQVTAIDEQLAGANADQAVGVIGSGARIFNDLATQASAAFRAAGVAAPEELRDVQRYQDTFRVLGIQNAELQSGLLDLAYATATAREPGKLTDADVQRAMQTIGANLQDPVAMRQVLRGAVKRARMDYDAQERTYFEAFGDNLNLGRAQFRDIAPLDGAAPAGGPAATSQPTGEEQWERGPDGRLRRVAQ